MLWRQGNEFFSYFWDIDDMIRKDNPTPPLKIISILGAILSGSWAFIINQFWPIWIILIAYLMIYIISWLNAFAKTCKEVEELKAQLVSKEQIFSNVLELQTFLSEWEKLGIVIPQQVNRMNLPSLMTNKKEEIYKVITEEDRAYLESFLTEEERGYLRNDIFAFAHCIPSYFDFWYKLRHLIDNKIKDLSS